MVEPSLTRLLRWYGKQKRKLPWRNTRDPYRILVSEIMLQQTQVPRVIDKYNAWFRCFPTWSSLAKARPDEVIRAWAGLGYNRRALHLRDAAQQIMRNGVPATVCDWERVKGVGPYTARAVYAITKRRPLIALDTNVRRVAGRWLLGRAYPSPQDDGRIERALLRAGFGTPAHWALPQACMDLGTAICAKTPDCASCPLAKDCKAANMFLRGIAGTQKPVRKKERIRKGKQFPDRIYRGRMVAFLREHGDANLHTIGRAIDPAYVHVNDAEWMRNITQRLIKDGILSQEQNRIFLAVE